MGEWTVLFWRERFLRAGPTPIAQRGKLSPKVGKGLAKVTRRIMGRDGTRALAPSLLPVTSGTPHLSSSASSLPLPGSPLTRYCQDTLQVDPWDHSGLADRARKWRAWTFESTDYPVLTGHNAAGGVSPGSVAILQAGAETALDSGGVFPAAPLSGLWRLALRPDLHQDHQARCFVSTRFSPSWSLPRLPGLLVHKISPEQTRGLYQHRVAGPQSSSLFSTLSLALVPPSPRSQSPPGASPALGAP